MAEHKIRQSAKKDTVYKNKVKKKKREDEDNVVSKKRKSELRRAAAEKSGKAELKKTGNKHADERRTGAVRARKNPVNIARGSAQNYIIKDKAQTVTNVGLKTAAAPSKAVSGALKNSQDRAGYGNKGKSGQLHSPTKRTDRMTPAQKKQEQTYKEQKEKEKKAVEIRQKEHEKNGYWGQSVIDKADSVTKKIEKTRKKVNKEFDKSKKEDLEYGASVFSDEKKEIPFYTKYAKAKAESAAKAELNKQGVTQKKGEEEVTKWATETEKDWKSKGYDVTDDTVVTEDGKTWGQIKKEAYDKEAARIEATRSMYTHEASDNAGKMSAQDIFKGSVEMGSEFIDYGIPYMATAKGSIKVAEKILAKAAKAGKTGAKTVPKIERAVDDLVKDGTLTPQAAKKLNRKIALKSGAKSFSTELIANALQDATIGTALDLGKGIGQGLKGEELDSYMKTNALANLALGIPMSGIAGKVGAKEAKIAMSMDYAKAINNKLNISKPEAIKMENLLKKQEKGTITAEETKTLEEIQSKAMGEGGAIVNDKGNLEVNRSDFALDDLTKPEVSEYFKLTAQERRGSLDPRDNQRLAELTNKVKNAYREAEVRAESTINISGRKITSSMQENAEEAVRFYERTGDTKKLKQAQEVLVKAQKATTEKNKALETNIDKMNEITKGNYRWVDSTEMENLTGDGHLGGFYDEGTGEIIVNRDSPQAYQTVVGHETMHMLKAANRQGYDKLANMLRDYVRELGGGQYESLVAEVKRAYPELVAKGDVDGLDEELVSEMLGRYVFGEDDAFIKKLAGEDPTILQKIIAYIKQFIANSNNKELADQFANMEKTALDEIRKVKEADWKARGLKEVTGKEKAEIIKKSQFTDAPVSSKDGFYSYAYEAAMQLGKRVKSRPESLRRYLVKKGVTAEEMQWTGINDFFDAKGKQAISKQELLDFIDANNYELSTIVKSDIGYQRDRNAKYLAKSEAALAKWLRKDTDMREEVLDGVESVINDDLSRQGMSEYWKMYNNNKAVTPDSDISEIAATVIEVEPRYALSLCGYGDDEIDVMAERLGVYRPEPVEEEARWSNYVLRGGENYREYEYVDPRLTGYSNDAMDVHWGDKDVVIHSRIQDFTTGDTEPKYLDQYDLNIEDVSRIGDAVNDSAEELIYTADSHKYIDTIESQFDIPIDISLHRGYDGFSVDIVSTKTGEVYSELENVPREELGYTVSEELFELGRNKTIMADWETRGNEKVLHVEEIQSDWHNAGQKYGYDRGTESVESLEKQYYDLDKEYERARSQSDGLEAELYAKFNEDSRFREADEQLKNINKKISDIEDKVWDLEDLGQEDMHSLDSLKQTAKEIRRRRRQVRDEISDKNKELYKRYSDSLEQTRTIANKLSQLGDKISTFGDKPPEAPYKNNYTDYAMKRALREAVENDYDVVSWTTAKQQADRWSDEYMEGYRIEYDQDIPSFMKRYVAQWGGKVEKLKLAENGEEVWGVRITDEMRDSIKNKGQRRWSKFGVEGATGEQRELGIKAEQMFASGESADKIWKETGWVVDSDGKAKMRFSDRDMSLNIKMKDLKPAKSVADIQRASDAIAAADTAFDEAIARNATDDELGRLLGNIQKAEERLEIAQNGVKEMPLGKLITHKELFDRYKQFENNITVRFTTKSYIGGEGMLVNTGGNTFTLYINRNGLTQQKLKSTLVHEIQHAIQDVEGFARGTSPEEWQQITKEIRSEMDEVEKNIPSGISFEKDGNNWIIKNTKTGVTSSATKPENVSFGSLGVNEKELRKSFSKWVELKTDYDNMTSAFKNTPQAARDTLSKQGKVQYYHTKGEWEARQAEAEQNASDGLLKALDKEEASGSTSMVTMDRDGGFKTYDLKDNDELNVEDYANKYRKGKNAEASQKDIGDITDDEFGELLANDRDFLDELHKGAEAHRAEKAERVKNFSFKTESKQDIKAFKDHLDDIDWRAVYGEATDADKSFLLEKAREYNDGIEFDAPLQVRKVTYDNGMTHEEWSDMLSKAEDKDYKALEEAGEVESILDQFIRTNRMPRHPNADAVNKMRHVEKVDLDSVKELTDEEAGILSNDLKNLAEKREAEILEKELEAAKKKAYKESLNHYVVKTSDYNIDVPEKAARYTNERIDSVIDKYTIKEGKNKGKSQAYVTMMNPDDFVRLTLGDDVRAEWQAGRELKRWDYDAAIKDLKEDAPHLYVDADTHKVVGHEGRHRLLTLHNNGIESVPVVIRWVENESAFDVRPVDAPMKKLEMTGQVLTSDGKAANGARVEVDDLIPASPKYKEEIKERFGGDAKIKFSKLSKARQEKVRSAKDKTKATESEIAGVDKNLNGKITDERRKELEERRKTLEEQLEQERIELNKLNRPVYQERLERWEKELKSLESQKAKAKGNRLAEINRKITTAKSQITRNKNLIKNEPKKFVSDKSVGKLSDEELTEEYRKLTNNIQKEKWDEIRERDAMKARIESLKKEAETRELDLRTNLERADDLVKEKGFGWQEAKSLAAEIRDIDKQIADIKKNGKLTMSKARKISELEKEHDAKGTRLTQVLDNSKSVVPDGKSAIDAFNETVGGNTLKAKGSGKKLNKMSAKRLIEENGGKGKALADLGHTVRRKTESSLIEYETAGKKLIKNGQKELGQALLDQSNNVIVYKNKAAAAVESRRASADGTKLGKSLNDVFKVEDKNGKVVDLLLEENAEMRQNLSNYLFAKHSFAREEQGKKVFGIIGEDGKPKWTNASTQEFMDEIVEKYGEKTVNSFEREIRDFINYLNEYRLDTGLISKELLDKLNDIYPYYIPTNRAVLNKPPKEYELPKTTAEVENGIRRAVGGDAPLEDLYTQLVKMTMATIRSGEQNKLVAMYAKAHNIETTRLPKDATADDVLESSVEAFDSDHKGNWKVRFYQDGEAVTIPVNRHAAKGLREFNGQDYATLMEVSAKAGQLFHMREYKGLITDWNIVFGVRNGMRDAQQALVNSKDTRWYTLSIPRAKSAVLNENNAFRALYDANGGRYSTLQQINRLDEIGALNKNRSTVAKGLEKIEDFNGAIEMMPRMCEFIGTLQKEADDILGKGGLDKLKGEIEAQAKLIPDAERTAWIENEYAQRIVDIIKKKKPDIIATAIRNSSDITVNFSRHGVFTRALNAGFVPYLNPSVQGLSKMMRMFSESKAQGFGKLACFGAKLGVLTIAPSMVNEILCQGNEAYQSINTRDKDNAFFIPMSLFGGDKDKFIKIPKPRENAVLAEPFEYGLRYFLDKAQYGTPDEFEQMFESAITNVGVVSPWEDNIFSPILNTALNKTWYGGDILSEQELKNIDNDEAWKNYDETTTIFGKKIGKLINVSPKKVDAILDSYTGLIYDFGLSQTSQKNINDVYSSPKNFLKNNPIVQQFTKDAVFSNKYATKFWDNVDRLNKGHVGDRDTIEKREYMAKYGYDTFTYDTAISNIDNDKSIPKTEKVEMKRELRKYKNQLLHRALNGEDVKYDPMQRIINLYKEHGIKNATDVCLTQYAEGDHADAYKTLKRSKEYRDATPEEQRELQRKFLKTYKGIKRIARFSGDSDNFINYTTAEYVCVKNGYTGGLIANAYAGKSKKYAVKKGMENMQAYIDAGYTEKNFKVTMRALNRGADALGDDEKQFASQLDDYDRAMICAKNGYRDGAYFVASPYVGEARMNAARCLTEGHSGKDYKWTDKRINKFCKKYEIYEDKKEHTWDLEQVAEAVKKEYADKTPEEQAAVYTVITGDIENNPFGEIGDYSHDNDTGLVGDKDDKGKGGRGRRGRRRGGRGGGGGGGGSAGAMPDTDSGAIKGKVTNPFSTSNGTKDSNLNNAYRKRLLKLREDMRK